MKIQNSEKYDSMMFGLNTNTITTTTTNNNNGHRHMLSIHVIGLLIHYYHDEKSISGLLVCEAEF